MTIRFHSLSVQKDIATVLEKPCEAKCKKDLVEWRAYAQQVNTADEAVENGAIGAAVGGVFGALIGNGNSDQRGVGTGVVSGGTSGAVRVEERKERIRYRCLKD